MTLAQQITIICAECGQEFEPVYDEQAVCQYCACDCGMCVDYHTDDCDGGAGSDAGD